MKIMQVVLNLECGGLEKLVIDLSSELNKKGMPASILCLEKKGKLASDAENKGIEVLSLGKEPGFDFSLPFKLASILKRKQIDLVHTHNFGPLIYGGIAAKIAGIPAINTRHSRTQKRISSLIWGLHRNIVTVSGDAKKELLRYNRIQADRVKVIYNGVSVNGKKQSKKEIASSLTSFAPRNDKGVSFRAEARVNLLYRKLYPPLFSSLQICRCKSNRRDKVENKQGGRRKSLESYRRKAIFLKVIGNVARLSEEKDHFTLLEAFSKVSKEIDNAILVIAGDGPLKESLQLKAYSLKLKDRVLFLGMRDDVRELMKGFDIFVLSSIREGISLTLLEAMAESKPIVATDAGGNREVVSDGETGFLVPKKNTEELAGRIIELLKDRKLADEMGRKGFERVKERFGLDRMVKEYRRLYENINRY